MVARAPKSAQCPFGDVSPQRYYYQAVLWAAEQRGSPMGWTPPISPQTEQ
ncbi:MAG: hypothetical protein ACLU9S_18675 [Oscillospiraceae bacterium]